MRNQKWPTFARSSTPFRFLSLFLFAAAFKIKRRSGAASVLHGFVVASASWSVLGCNLISHSNTISSFAPNSKADPAPNSVQNDKSKSSLLEEVDVVMPSVSTLEIGNLFEYTLKIRNSKETVVHFSCDGSCPQGFSVNTDSGVLQWNPELSQLGPQIVNIVVQVGEKTLRRSLKVSVVESEKSKAGLSRASAAQKASYEIKCSVDSMVLIPGHSPSVPLSCDTVPEKANVEWSVSGCEGWTLDEESGNFVGTMPSAACTLSVSASLKKEKATASVALNLPADAWYFDPQGSDLNDGRTPATAKRSLSSLNNILVSPGSFVLLKGGSTFNIGSISQGLVLRALDGGDALRPISVTSYGLGKATIAQTKEVADDGLITNLPLAANHALTLYNSSGISVENLNFEGAGATSSITKAISVVFDSASPDISGAHKNLNFKNLSIDGYAGCIDVDVSGANTKISGLNFTDNVYTHARKTCVSVVAPSDGFIENLSFTGNRFEQMVFNESGSDSAVKVSFAKNVVFSKNLVASITADGALQFNNSSFVTVAENEIREIRRLSWQSGYTFALSLNNSTFEKNYVHDTDGGVFNFAGADNVFRYNAFMNVAQNPSAQWMGVWLVWYSVRNDIVNNLVVTANVTIVNSDRGSVDTRFLNNTFVKLSPGSMAIFQNYFGTTHVNLTLAGNTWWNTSEAANFQFIGASYSNIAALASAPFSPEYLNGVQAGRFADPLLTSLSSPNLMPQNPLSALSSCRPLPGSPLLGTGLRLSNLSPQASPGISDFNGVPFAAEFVNAGACSPL